MGAHQYDEGGRDEAELAFGTDEEVELQDDSMLDEEDGEVEMNNWKESLQEEAEEQEDVEVEEGMDGFIASEQVDDETRRLAAGLASKDSVQLMQALREMTKVLTGSRGGKVLLQYVLASPRCAELVSVWEAGAVASTAVPLMLLLSEIFRHQVGRGRGTPLGEKGKAVLDASAHKKRKAMVVVQGRLDKLARAITRTKMKDIYSHLSSSKSSRQKAALLLMSCIVLRGRLIAIEVATSFDFTLKALKKLAEHPWRAPVQRDGAEGRQGLLARPSRFFFIEFALSFLVVGDPGLLRWILQKRPLYAGVLHGLAKDDETTIIHVLQVIREKVMGKAALVPAGLQSAVFGDVALEQLARIAGNDLFGDSADLAYQMLLSLCTDPSHGLCPESTVAWGLPGAKSGAFGGGQGRLLRLMLRLRATEVGRHRELLLAIAKARPKLAAAYLDSVPFSLEPRSSPSWFSAMSLIADLICIASTPHSFSSMALQGLPTPTLDGPLVRSSLRRLLPRALPRVALNRGLQHANLLVKHASLRVLLEALLSVERFLDAAIYAAEALSMQNPVGGLEVEGICMHGCEFGLAQGKTVRSSKSVQSGQDSWRGNLTGVQGGNSCMNKVHSKEETELYRQDWLQLAENIQDVMRASLPDRNTLLIIHSSLRTPRGETKTLVDSQKRTCSAKGYRAGKRRRKVKGNSGRDGGESEEEDDLDNREEGQILAQVWGAEMVLSQNNQWGGDTGCFLHAKLLEVLAAYQRVLPLAFADKGFDPFRMLPPNSTQLSFAQQKAFLSLLLASTGAPDCGPTSAHSAFGYADIAGSGQIYKHVTPLLKMMVGSNFGEVRDQANLLTSRIMVSTGAFESNFREVMVWLDLIRWWVGVTDNNDSPVNGTLTGHLKWIVEFISEAVVAVGRNLYKYLDQLHSLLAADTLEEGSSGQGVMAPEFGPFVVCVLEHTLQALHADSKGLKLSQRAEISVYVAGVLNLLLQTQANARALAVIIDALLSADSGLPTSLADSQSFHCEWGPLQVLLLHAHSILKPVKDLSYWEICKSDAQNWAYAGQIAAVLEACENSEGDALAGERLAFTSALVCCTPHEIAQNFSRVTRVCLKVFKGNFSLLHVLCAVHCGLLSMVADAVPEEFARAVELAAWGPRNEDLAGKGLTTECLPDSVLLKQRESSQNSFPPSPGGDLFPLAAFLRGLPFSVVLPAAAHSNEWKLLASKPMIAVLEAACTQVPISHWSFTGRIILTWIYRLAPLSRRGLDVTGQLETCFALLQRIAFPPEGWQVGSGEDNRQGMALEKLKVYNVMISELLAHPVFSDFFMCQRTQARSSFGLGVEERHLEDSGRKRERNAFDEGTDIGTMLEVAQVTVQPLDYHLVTTLRRVLHISSSLDGDVKSIAVAQQLNNLKETTATACQPYIARAITAFRMELLGSANGQDPRGDSLLSALFAVSELVPYADSEVLIELLQSLFSKKAVPLKHVSRQISPPVFAHPSFGLYFAKLFYEGQKAKTGHWTWSKWSGSDLGAVEQQSLVDIFKTVIELALQQPSEAGDLCLLSALLAPNMVGKYSQLVSITPVEVLRYCVVKPSQVTVEIAMLLVQASSVHMAEFGNLIVAGTKDRVADGMSGSHVELAVKLSSDNHLRYKMNEAPFSDEVLLLLIPPAEVYLSKTPLRLTNHVARHVALVYLGRLSKHFKHWNTFIDTYSGIGSTDSTKLEFLRLSDCGISNDLWGDFLRSASGRIMKLLHHCLSWHAISLKKQDKLIRHLLPKDGTALASLDAHFQHVSEHDLRLQIFKLFSQVSIIKQLFMSCHSPQLDDKLVEVQTEGSKGTSEFPGMEMKGGKKQSGANMSFAASLVATLGVLFKQTQGTQLHTKHLTPGYISTIHSHHWRPNVIKFLEEYLLACLTDIATVLEVDDLDSQAISLLRMFAMTALKYRFGDASTMLALQALSVGLFHGAHGLASIAAVSEVATSVLDLVMAHSQFVPSILSSGSVQRLHNLGGHAGKDTMLTSLSSLLSLVGSPLVSHLDGANGQLSPKKDMEDEVVTKSVEEAGDDEQDRIEQRRLQLVKLVRLLFWLKMRPGSIAMTAEERATLEELISLLLAAYGATMNKVDLEIFELMHELEAYGGAGCVGLAGRDYLWGEAALKRRRARAEEIKLTSDEDMVADEMKAEARRRTFREDLAIDPQRCGLSVLHFPANRQPWEGLEEVDRPLMKGFHQKTGDADEQGLMAAAYDPAYILPFALHGLSIGCIDADVFVHQGLLAVALASISSANEIMRKLGYEILAKFLTVLEEGPSFKGRPQIRLLLTYVKNAITEAWQRLPFVLTLFAAEASCILMHPENALYLTITRYLLRGPGMDLEYVPLFHSMFGSGSPGYRSERLWMLRLLAFGLASSHDFQVYRRQFLLEILMSFYGSPLADTITRKWVLQVLRKAARIGWCAQALVERAGFLPWLSFAAVNAGEADTGVKDGSEACDMAAMVLEVIERVLRWKVVEQRGLAEGMEELSTVALGLHHFLTHGCANCKQRAVFRRPTLRIMTTVLHLSQRRKKHQTHFSLSLNGIWEVIQWVETEGPDIGFGVSTTQETQALALQLLLQSSPPAAATHEDKMLLFRVATWAVAVAMHMPTMFNRSPYLGHGQQQKVGYAEGGQIFPESIPEKLLRWLGASLILGKSVKGKVVAKVGAQSPATCWSVLIGSTTVTLPASSVNDKLAGLLVQLHRHVGIQSSGGSSVSIVTSLEALWPFRGSLSSINSGKEGDKALIQLVEDLVQLLLSDVPTPEETDPAWRWSYNSPWKCQQILAGELPVQSLYQVEVNQAILAVFEQLLVGFSQSHLFHLISKWKAALVDTSKEVQINNNGRKVSGAMNRLQWKVHDMLQRSSAVENFQA